MADTATPKKKAAAKPKKPAAHPKYSEMVAQAVGSLKKRGGSSRAAILKYIVKNFNVGKDEKSVNSHLKMALRAGVKNGSLKQTKGTGASGSFRLGEKKAAAKPKKTTKKPKAAAKPKTAKKPKARKPQSPRRRVPRRSLLSQRRLLPSPRKQHPQRRKPASPRRLSQRKQQQRSQPRSKASIVFSKTVFFKTIPSSQRTPLIIYVLTSFFIYM